MLIELDSLLDSQLSCNFEWLLFGNFLNFAYLPVLTIKSLAIAQWLVFMEQSPMGSLFGDSQIEDLKLLQSQGSVPGVLLFLAEAISLAKLVLGTFYALLRVNHCMAGLV